jgi:hypothetical protein
MRLDFLPQATRATAAIPNWAGRTFLIGRKKIKKILNFHDQTPLRATGFGSFLS